MVTVKKTHKARDRMDYIRSATLVARWGRCAKIGSLIYKSKLSDEEVDIFHDQIKENLYKM